MHIVSVILQIMCATIIEMYNPKVYSEGNVLLIKLFTFCCCLLSEPMLRLHSVTLIKLK